MKYFTKNVFTLLVAMAAMCVTNHVTAQLFMDDFSSDADYQTEWVTGGMTPVAADWVWTDDPGSPTYGTQPDFASPTVENGFIQFNSGGMDQAFDVTVTMVDPFDASTADQVFLQFENQYAFFSSSTNAQVGVSTDGIEFTYYTVLSDVVANDVSSANKSVVLELPIAANEAEVWLQFRWVGSLDYAWKIDDIVVNDFDPTPPVQYNLGSYTFYPVSSYSQPLEQIEVDSFGFFAEVQNTGSGDLTDVVVTASVLSGAGTVLYSASEMVDVLEAGQSDTFDIEGLFAPDELEIGAYTIEYDITTAEGVDDSPANNSLSIPFVVSLDRFSKIPSVLAANRPGGGTDYLIGNVYQTSPNILPGVLAFGDATFTAAISSAESVPLAGRNATVILAKVLNSEVDQEWNGWVATDELFTNPGLELLAFIPHTFEGANFDLQTVSLLDVDNEELIYMEPNTRYILGLQFEGDDNITLIGFSDAINYYQISTIVYTSQWYLGGLGEDFSADINVSYAMIVDNTTDTPLSPDAMNVFPNPTSDQISLEVDLDYTDKANIVLADLTGKIMKINEFQNLANGTYNFDVSNYPNGVYFARLITEKGSHTVKFTVQH